MPHYLVKPVGSEDRWPTGGPINRVVIYKRRSPDENASPPCGVHFTLPNGDKVFASVEHYNRWFQEAWVSDSEAVWRNEHNRRKRARMGVT